MAKKIKINMGSYFKNNYKIFILYLAVFILLFYIMVFKGDNGLLGWLKCAEKNSKIEKKIEVVNEEKEKLKNINKSLSKDLYTKEKFLKENYNKGHKGEKVRIIKGLTNENRR